MQPSGWVLLQGRENRVFEASKTWPPARWSRAWRSIAIGLVAACVGAAALLVVVLNLVLRTRLLRHLLGGDPSALWVDYASAYSLVPGRVHAVGLAIRGRERTEEWLLTIDRVDFTVSLFELLHRRFHCTRVRASGLALDVRLRMDPAAATPEVVAAVPQIPGFEPIPLLPGGPPPPPIRDEDYRLWSIALDDVVAEHVREVWMQTLRADGDMRVHGRWFFRPVRWLDVGPATVEVREADVFHGLRPIATDVVGGLEATIHPFDVRTADGLAFFEHVSTELHLSGRLDAAGAADALAGAAESPVAHGEGPFQAHVVVDHGSLGPGSEGSAIAEDLEAAGPGSYLQADAARAHLTLEGSIPASDFGGHLSVTVEPLRVRGHEHAHPSNALLGEASAQVLAHWSKREGVLDLSGTNVTLGPVHAAAPESGATVAVQSLAFAAPLLRLDTRGGRLSVKSELKARGLEVTIGEAATHADVLVQVRAQGSAAWTDISGTSVEVTHAALRDGDAPGDENVGDWWGQLDTAHGRLRLVGGTSFDGALVLKAKDAAPATALAVRKANVPAWIARLFAMPGLDVAAHVHLSPSSLAVRSLVAKGGGKQLRLEYVREGDRTAGAVLADLGWMDVGYDLSDGARGLVLAEPEQWFNRMRGRLGDADPP